MIKLTRVKLTMIKLAALEIIAITTTLMLVAGCSSILLEANTQSPNKSYSTINGSINVGSSSSVKNASTVNDNINLTGKTYIKGNVQINNAGSGRIKSVFWDSVTEVNIGPDVIIDGVLSYQRKVTLNIDPAAKVINSSVLK